MFHQVESGTHHWLGDSTDFRKSAEITYSKHIKRNSQAYNHLINDFRIFFLLIDWLEAARRHKINHMSNMICLQLESG